MSKRFILLLLLFVPLPSWAVIVSFEPSTNDIFVGDTFTVDIIADIQDPVLGWGMDVNFDSSILSFSSAPAIGSDWMAAVSSDGDGLAGLAFPTPVSGANILLATLSFEALAIGSSDLMGATTVSDFTEGFALLEPGAFADVSFINSVITVSERMSVPEPGTFALFAVGLILITFQKYRKPTAFNQ